MSWSRIHPRLTPPPPPVPGAVPFVDWGPPLPETHGVTFITALVRDPERFFVFWEGGDRLRARDLTAGAISEMAAGRVGAWYFPGVPEHEYEVELLLDGRVAAVSNRFRLPRRDPAVQVDEEWVPDAGQLEVLKLLASSLERQRRGLEPGMHS